MLEGSLETFALPSILRLLTDSAAGGRLSIHAALGTGWLSISSGRVVDAGPPVAGDVTEGALALFEHRTGTFSFRPEASAERRVDLSVPELLNLVAERQAAWEKIHAALPGDGTILVAPAAKGAEVTVSHEAWRVAVLAGGRTPAQLAAASGLSEFRACSVLLDLVAEGLIGLKAQSSNGDHAGPQVHQQRPARERVAATERVRPAAPAVELEPVEATSDFASVAELAPAVAEVRDEDLDSSLLLRELGGDAPALTRRRR